MLSAVRGLAAVEAIFAECFRTFAALPNGRVIDTPEVTGVINDVPLAFFNGIGRSQLTGDTDSAIEGIIEIYRARRRPFRWWISPSTRPEGLVDALRRHGFRHVYDSTGMGADLRTASLDVAPPRELSIRRVTTREELQQWASILLTVFARPGQDIPLWIEAYSHLGLESGPWHHYIGYAGEAAVATASVLFAGQLAGVYHVSTLAEWRGRGFAAALTLETMRQARDAGATEIVLQSSEMGTGVYRSLGFTAYCDLTLYDHAS